MTGRGPNRQALFDVASEQDGYFTTNQAARCGYAPDMLTYHVKRGTFQRVYRGVYRFRDYPFSPREHVAAAWLAVGKDISVVSHESALDLWDLSDVVPDAVHLTVPRARRSLANRPPLGVVVHTSARRWADGEVRSREGIRLTSPERTVLDAAEAGTQPEQIELAIAQAIRRGWIDVQKLLISARARGKRVASLVERALATHQPGATS
ncbi:MAG: type IV toxin-antitoxin system AbiEi family antitoxin domain-containing protein [Chloroflexi bacterium]|nr:type IV toxin-antitoxin system AbiEi family antitoxin domain-containing protein [Chloroflexota bacterium]